MPLTWNVNFCYAGTGTSSEYLDHVDISRSLGQGQGHSNKKHVGVSYPVHGQSASCWKAVLCYLLCFNSCPGQTVLFSMTQLQSLGKDRASNSRLRTKDPTFKAKARSKSLTPKVKAGLVTQILNSRTCKDKRSRQKTTFLQCENLNLFFSARQEKQV